MPSQYLQFVVNQTALYLFIIIIIIHISYETQLSIDIFQKTKKKNL